ncbi:Polycystin-2 [Diplonema papillatum]|nr:Polycystin-2 [Diplonema papillatum]
MDRVCFTGTWVPASPAVASAYLKKVLSGKPAAGRRRLRTRDGSPGATPPSDSDEETAAQQPQQRWGGIGDTQEVEALAAAGWRAAPAAETELVVLPQGEAGGGAEGHDAGCLTYPGRFRTGVKWTDVQLNLGLSNGGSGAGLGELVPVHWDPKEVIVVIHGQVLTKPPKTPAGETANRRSFATPVHTCIDLGAEGMALELVNHNPSLLDVSGGPHNIRPFLAALLNYGKPALRSGVAGDLVSKLLVVNERESIDENKLEIRRRCLQTVEESLQRPYVLLEKSWYLQVIEQNEQAARSLARQLYCIEDTRRLLRSILLHALHSASAVAGPVDGLRESSTGDRALVSKVLHFMASLDYIHQSSVPQSFILEVAPTELDVAHSEKILDTVFWTNRYLVGNNCERLCSAVSSMKRLFHDGESKRQFTMDELCEELAAAGPLPAATGDGERVIQHSGAVYKTLKEDGRDTDAEDIAIALIQLMQLHVNGPENALQIAVRFERTDIVDLLVNKCKRANSITAKELTELLREAFRLEKWAAVATLLPHVTSQSSGAHVFSCLPSAVTKETDTGRKEYAYPEPPSLKEITLCREHELVHPRNFSAVLNCHPSWLVKRSTSPKTVRLICSKVPGKSRRFTLFPGVPEAKNKAAVFDWLNMHPTSDIRFYDDRTTYVQLIYDDVIDGELYRVHLEPQLAFKTVHILGPDVGKKIDVFEQATRSDNERMVRRRFLLPQSVALVVQNSLGETVEFLAKNLTDGETYSLLLKGLVERTWKDVMLGTHHAAKEQVQIIRYLLGTKAVDLNNFFGSPSNRQLFPWFDFGPDNVRAGEIFVVICKQLADADARTSPQLFVDGFTLAGVSFAPAEYNLLRYPLHALLLKARETRDAAAGASADTPERDRLEEEREQHLKRVSGLACEAIAFINQVIAQKETTAVPSSVKNYIKGLPCSSYPGFKDDAPGRTRRRRIAMLEDFEDLFPVEMSIRLHNTQVLRAILGLSSEGGGEGEPSKMCGLEPMDIRCDSKAYIESSTVTFYNDTWFPENSEWEWVENEAVVKPVSGSRKPLLHQALALLPHPPKTKYMHDQKHVLCEFTARSHLSQGARQGAAHRWIVAEDKGGRLDGDARRCDGGLTVCTPWLPPGNQHLEEWMRNTGATPEDVARRDTVDALLQSAVSRASFNIRSSSLHRNASARLTVHVGRKEEHLCVSPVFDRCGLFRTVPLHSPTATVSVCVLKKDSELEVTTVALAPDTKTLYLRLLVAGSLAENQAQIRLTTVDGRVIEDDETLGSLSNNSTKLVVYTETRLGAQATLNSADHGDSDSDDTRDDEEAAPWPLQLSEMGLAFLFQKAPWVLMTKARRYLLRHLEAYPMGSPEALDRAVAASFSPVVIERRHQWNRSFRVRSWWADAAGGGCCREGPAAQPPPDDFCGVACDQAPPPDVSCHAGRARVVAEPPGEQDLVVDVGLGLAHWACVNDDADLLRLLTDELNLPLATDGSPPLTLALRYSCAHYAAYTASVECLDRICQWKLSSEREGRALLDYQVPRGIGKPALDGGGGEKREKKQAEKQADALQKLAAKSKGTPVLCSWCVAEAARRGCAADLDAAPDFFPAESRAGTGASQLMASGTGFGAAYYASASPQRYSTGANLMQFDPGILEDRESSTTGIDEDSAPPATDSHTAVKCRRCARLQLAVFACLAPKDPPETLQKQAGGGRRRASAGGGKDDELSLSLRQRFEAVWRGWSPKSGKPGPQSTFTPQAAANPLPAPTAAARRLSFTVRTASSPRSSEHKPQLPQLQQLQQLQGAAPVPARAADAAADKKAPTVLDRWVKEVACVLNVRGCEGGGGLVRRRAVLPPTAGDTPLMVATQFCHHALIRRMVVGHQAKVGLKNYEGYDAHDIAVLLQQRYEMQPVSQQFGETPEEPKVLGHKKNSEKTISKLVVSLNACPAVQQKLLKFAMIHFLRSVLRFSLFTVIVTIIAMNVVQDNHKFFAQNSLSSVFNTEEWDTTEIEIDDSPVAWRSFQENLLSTLELEDFVAWFQGPFPSKVLGENPYGLFFLVGSVRLVKRDKAPSPCVSLDSVLFSSLGGTGYKGPLLGQQCYGTFREGTAEELTDKRWAHWDTRPVFSSTWSRLDYYLDTGETLDVTPGNKTNLEIVATEDDGWVDHRTRFVAAFFTFYNEHIDTFVVCQVFFEVFAQGTIQQSTRYRSVRVNSYQTGGDAFRAVLEVIFCFFVAVHILSEAIDLTVTFKRVSVVVRREHPHLKGSVWRNLRRGELSVAGVLGPLRQQLVSHFFADWNMLDIMGIALQVLLVITTVRVRSLQNKLAANTRLLAESDVFFDEFIPLSWLVRDQELFLGLTVFFAWIKLMKAGVTVPKYGPIINALVSTITDRNLFIFGLVFAWVIVAFYFGMITAFGSSVSAFRLPGPAALTVFKIILGDTEAFPDMEEANSIWGPVFFACVVIFCQIVLLNLIVAVLQEIYVQAINDAQGAWSSDIVELYRYSITSVVNPNSVAGVLVHFVRQLGLGLKFKEKTLKCVSVSRSSFSYDDVSWLIVPLMEPQGGAAEEVCDDEDGDGDEHELP